MSYVGVEAGVQAKILLTLVFCKLFLSSCNSYTNYVGTVVSSVTNTDNMPT